MAEEIVERFHGEEVFIFGAFGTLNLYRDPKKVPK